MPGGKLRLKGLFTGGMQVGSNGTYAKQLIAGSANVEVGSMAAGIASIVCEVVTITGLTASHILVAQVASGNACTILTQAVAGVGQASLFWQNNGGSDVGKASQTTTKIEYIAIKV